MLSLMTAAAVFSACGAEEQTAPDLLEPVKQEPDTAVVQYEDVFNLTAEEGCILPVSRRVAFLSDGVVESVEVEPGQTVKAGDLLARLDTEDVNTRLLSLNAQLEEAITVAARTNSSLQMAIEICREELNALNAAGDSYAAAVKEVDLWTASMELRHAKENQQVQQQKLQQQIDELQAWLVECSELRAPSGGIVSWMMEGSLKGRSVAEHEILLCIADPTSLYITTERISDSVIESSDRIYARIGDKQYELVPRKNSTEQDLADTFAQIPLTSKFDFAVQPEEDLLSQGGNALVLCRWRYRANVLCIPRGAIFRDGEGTYVYRVVDGVMTRTPVETGIGTTLRTEILSGLEEGDVVYVAE